MAKVEFVWNLLYDPDVTYQNAESDGDPFSSYERVAHDNGLTYTPYIDVTKDVWIRLEGDRKALQAALRTLCTADDEYLDEMEWRDLCDAIVD